MEPEDKTALVTGGAHRVGRAITLALARAGANVVINYHTSSDATEATAAEARAPGVDALPVQADVSDRQTPRVILDRARPAAPADRSDGRASRVGHDHAVLIN